ncbi:MAG TPA: methylenetetrahydrofolate reductase [NAD(P)H] [Leptolyngbyaceae cyanobacterium]
MTINELPISFELFPPKTEAGLQNLQTQYELLIPCNPRFFSVTYGAGGSTRDRTQRIVLDLLSRGIPAVPHLSCIAETGQSLQALLDLYQKAGVRYIVTLRGDLPQEVQDVANEFHYANELVAFIRQHYGHAFDLVVAAYPEVHPEAGSAQQDLINFKRKVDAGASAAITQYFYNADAYEDFVHRCHQQGITIPIYPGIMPITNYDRLLRFSNQCGAELPRWLQQRLLDYKDEPESLQAFGTEVVANLCEKLIAIGVPGFHFYILNQATPTLNLLDALGLNQSASKVEAVKLS